ncbi:MAG TPA: SDR family NAD(P)-dependent oxidoreductase, partial [Myxococcaceae bacterium]|nr:SDR family NAD(P)-dependent oxidoreductase [Myxococcaceae bacterium]
MNKQWVKALAWGAGAVWALSRMKRRYNLTGKVVAISGGSRGLGLDLAQAFAARGARVAICGRDPQTLRRAELLLAQRGITVLATPCDVTDPVRLKGWLDEVETRMGAVDVLVNNAGVISV